MLLDSQNAFLLNPLLRQCFIYSVICFEVYRLNRCLVTVGSSIACFFWQQKYYVFKPLSRCTWSYAYVLVVVLLLRNGFFLGDYFFGWDDSFHKIYKFISAVLMQYRISCMAIGAIGAYWVAFEKKKILSVVYRKDVQWIVYIITAGLLLLRVGVKIEALESFPSVFHEVYSVLFIIIIVNLATNPKSIVRLDYKWTNYLGKISYGLYMYHPIMRILSLELTTYLFKGNTWNWQMNVSLYFFTLSSTILISILSYEFFEKKFLKLKNKVTAQA